MISKGVECALNVMKTESGFDDMAIISVRQKLGDHEHASVALASHYHNLLRRWAEL